MKYLMGCLLAAVMHPQQSPTVDNVCTHCLLRSVCPRVRVPSAMGICQETLIWVLIVAFLFLVVIPLYK